MQQVRRRARGRCASCRRRSRRRCWRRTPGRGAAAASASWPAPAGGPAPSASRCRSRPAPRGGPAAGDCTASCCASPPPQESPRTSNSPVTQLRHHAATPGRQRRIGYGTAGSGRAADPGHVEPDHAAVGVERVDEAAGAPPGWRRCRCTAAAAVVGEASAARADRRPAACDRRRRPRRSRSRLAAQRSMDIGPRGVAQRLEARAEPSRRGLLRSGPLRSPSHADVVRPTRALAPSRRRQPLLRVGRVAARRSGSVAFGLPGGLTIDAMCPLVDSTNFGCRRRAAGWCGSRTATGTGGRRCRRRRRSRRVDLAEVHRSVPSIRRATRAR